MADYQHALRSCRKLVKLSNSTTDSADLDLLFRTCMCANHWQPSCKGIVDDEDQSQSQTTSQNPRMPRNHVSSKARQQAAGSLTHNRVHQGDEGAQGTSLLPKGPVVPLCIVSVVVLIGIAGMIYAYVNRKKLNQQAEVRDRRRTFNHHHIASCSTSHSSRSGESSETSSIAAEPPPPYSVAAVSPPVTSQNLRSCDVSVSVGEAPPPYQSVVEGGVKAKLDFSANHRPKAEVSANDRPPESDVTALRRPPPLRRNLASLPTIDEGKNEEE